MLELMAEMGKQQLNFREPRHIKQYNSDLMNQYNIPGVQKVVRFLSPKRKPHQGPELS